MNKRLHFVIALILGFAAIGSIVPAGAADKLENIPLDWKPTTNIPPRGSVNLTGLENAKLQIDPFTDSREDLTRIGQNTDKIPVRKVTTQENVARFVNYNMKNLISGVGVNVVESGGTVIMKGEVVKFFADEGKRYNGEVELRLTFTDPSGKVLWAFMTNGTSSRYGISYKAANYYEVLSDAIINATNALLQNPRFRETLMMK